LTVMRVSRFAIALVTIGPLACGHSSSSGSGDAAVPFTGRPGDLGTGSSVIDH
jgi:hypothetical protein